MTARSAPADRGAVPRYTAMVNYNGAVEFVPDDEGRWVLYSTLSAFSLSAGLHHHNVPGVGALWWDAEGNLVGGPEDD